MKTRHKPIDPPGIGRLSDGDHCHGIPLRLDPLAHLAQAHGVGKKGWIGVSNNFFLLTGRQQRAVLLHEECHLRRHHLLKRIAFLPLFWTPWGQRLAAKQELEADRFAAEHGFGLDLLKIVRTYPSGHFYPEKEQRIEALRACS